MATLWCVWRVYQQFSLKFPSFDLTVLPCQSLVPVCTLYVCGCMHEFAAVISADQMTWADHVPSASYGIFIIFSNLIFHSQQLLLFHWKVKPWHSETEHFLRETQMTASHLPFAVNKIFINMNAAKWQPQSDTHSIRICIIYARTQPISCFLCAVYLLFIATKNRLFPSVFRVR